MIIPEIPQVPQYPGPTVEVQQQPELLDNNAFFERVSPLMRDEAFLIEFADACDTAYRENEKGKLEAAGQEVPGWLNAVLLSDEEKALLMNKPVEPAKPAENEAQSKEQSEAYTEQLAAYVKELQKYEKAQLKQAKNQAALYAVIGGLMIMEKFGLTDSVHKSLLQLAEGTQDAGSSDINSITAWISWAAGQPYQDRDKRAVMQPWDLLPEDEKHKDIVQAKAAATVIQRHLSV